MGYTAPGGGVCVRFTKMQGIGNDYVYLNCLRGEPSAPEQLAVRISDRHFGIGSDGLVLICPPTVPDADFRMRMFNSDGSESEMCGNACRCVGKYVYERGLSRKTELALQTGAGVVPMQLRLQGDSVRSVRVDMGVPQWRPEAIPLNTALLPPQAAERALGVPLSAAGVSFSIHCLAIGNPHCVIFCPEVRDVPLASWGPAIEHHPLFPAKVNVEFVQLCGSGQLRVRVWERGAGETLACGSGACAALAAAFATGRCAREVSVLLPGGSLQLCAGEDGHIYQEGPAAFVFDGEWPDGAAEA